MIDLLGSIVVELKDDTAVDTWSEGRVRGEELAPGDAQQSGSFRRWVRIQHIGGLPRLRRSPVQFPRFAVTAGGLTPQDAMAGYGYVTDALHPAGAPKGARLRNNGIGIYISFEDVPGDPELDPDTKQPIVTAIFQVIAPIFAI